jgi:hypothetical protein
MNSQSPEFMEYKYKLCMHFDGQIYKNPSVYDELASLLAKNHVTNEIRGNKILGQADSSDNPHLSIEIKLHPPWDAMMSNNGRTEMTAVITTSEEKQARSKAQAILGILSQYVPSYDAKIKQ